MNGLWQLARSGKYPRNRHCPACNKRMAEVPVPGKHGTEHLDVCTVCQFVWFDPSEYEAIPVIPGQPTIEDRLPREAREKLAILQLEGIREDAHGDEWGRTSPDAWWHWIVGVLGMPIEQDVPALRRLPWMTWGLVLLTCIVSVASFSDLNNVILQFGLVPAHFTRYGGLTFVTSFLLHGGAFHLIGNMYFLLVFGDNVEDWLGKWRFLVLLACAAVVGDLVHIFGNLDSTVPCVGASGGISGIITFYALKFPHARLGLLFRVGPFFRWVRMPAFGMFMLWIGMQCIGVWSQLAGFSNVSSLAHLGGVGVGFLFWLLTRE